jgi:hypothetical protein
LEVFFNVEKKVFLGKAKDNPLCVASLDFSNLNDPG